VNEAHPIKPLSVDLSNFIRIVYPGILVTAFIYWRHSKALDDNLGVLLVMMPLILGIIFYAFYRGVLHDIVRYIQAKTVGIPQYKFHLSVADKLRAPQELKSMQVASACLSNVLMKKASPEFRFQNRLQNSFSHALFMTAFLLFAFFLHDIIALLFFGFELSWIWLWLFVFILIFGVGIRLDRQADLREDLFLRQNQAEYEEVLSTYIN
jgi:hypothetical protein